MCGREPVAFLLVIMISPMISLRKKIESKLIFIIYFNTAGYAVVGSTTKQRPGGHIMFYLEIKDTKYTSDVKFPYCLFLPCHWNPDQ